MCWPGAKTGRRKSWRCGTGGVTWQWDSRQLRLMKLRDGAYLLRSNMARLDPAILWRQYVQLTEVEEAFRVLKSELNIRPIWHRIDRRVEAHVLIAFMGYALWACLKQKLRKVASSITPARALESLTGILMVEVWFTLRDGRQICLPRITDQKPNNNCSYTIYNGPCRSSHHPRSIPWM
jgi:hypothetical protein